VRSRRIVVDDVLEFPAGMSPAADSTILPVV
jgi:hypothetical protein